MINLAAPGEPGSKGNPMTVEQLEEFLSKANNGAEVKVRGFTELTPAEVVTMESNKLQDLVESGRKLSTGLSINRTLSENLKQSLKDIKRTPKKMFEDRERGLFLALDQENNLWLLEKSTWHEIKEPGFPDLPKKEIS